jgi:hypothetical protein
MDTLSGPQRDSNLRPAFETSKIVRGLDRKATRTGKSFAHKSEIASLSREEVGARRKGIPRRTFSKRERKKERKSRTPSRFKHLY